MADIKLFKISGNVEQLPSGNVTLERDLQIVIENNMPEFFGVTFLASEFSTNNGGRMDSLGIDENNCPVIFEYKRSQNENVINQGLFYLDWLLMHKDSFKVLVIEVLGLEQAKEIDWSMPRVICIAGDFNKYDECAINQMDKNISLIRYKKFGNDLLMFELLNQNINQSTKAKISVNEKKQKQIDSTISIDEKVSIVKDVSTTGDCRTLVGDDLENLYSDLRDFVVSLGDDVSEYQMKCYIAFKKIKNFLGVQFNKKNITLTLKIDPQSIKIEDGYTKDVSRIGHFAPGDVQLYIKSKEDLEKAKLLIERSYKEN